MSYFVLFEEDHGENVSMALESRTLDCLSGREIDATDLALPITVLMRYGEDDFYGQYDPDFEGEYVPRPAVERLKASYNDGTLMSAELVAALRSAGVDNLQVLPTRVLDGESREPIAPEYLVVNVLGRLDCAMREAAIDPEDGRAYADRLVIDAGKTRGLKLFRVTASRSTLIVDETVARILSSDRFPGVRADSVRSL